ncbi:MAG TPA: UvrD-helicase domain-containing protein, partial [Alphaproteobacteria bacterium]|nr:UvrD-helicase domain-containing protein [Alphaproteobacteria bacterium]
MSQDELHGLYHVWGPPGTGKTTFLSKQVHRLVEDYGPDCVMIASLTRTAAAEVAGRRLPIPRQAIGTLHAHCYRALNHPTIAETKIDEWNAQAIENYRLSFEASGLDDVVTEQVSGKQNGDILMQKYQVHRARMDPPSEWTPHVKLFAEAWEKWKYENGYFDFQDLITTCYTDIDVAPGDPQFIIIDEAQDMDRQA